MPPTTTAQPAHRRDRAVRFFRREIWRPDRLETHSARGRFYAFLRVISITVGGLFENKTASRAAALSFSSLLGLGPLVAIAMLVAGFVLDQQDPARAVRALHGMLTFVAPSISEYEKLGDQARPAPPPSAGGDLAPVATGRQNSAPAAGASARRPARRTRHASSAPATPVNQDLTQLIDGFIAGSRSGTAGVVGGLTLVLIVLQLFTSIENAFNEIWGVRRGRSWLLRIVFYWTLVSLGAVLFFAAVAALGAGAFVNVFMQSLPLGDQLLRALRVLLPVISIVVLVLVLAAFYRYIPNTRVFWRAAFTGAVVVAALLLLNNFLAFFYFRRVMLSRSLYRSLGVLPILMFGLYIFWFFVLVGGQISYAVQNVHFRSSRAAWNSLAEAARERLALITLLTVCRRFQQGLPALTASQLGAIVRVPTQIINECLNRLVDLRFVTPVPAGQGGTPADYFFQPARALDRMTLHEFRQAFAGYGEDPAGETLDALDPISKAYHERIARPDGDDFFSQPLDRLLGEFPFDESRPSVRALA